MNARMAVHDLLPTRKVTAFVLGGALTIIGFWLAVDVFAVLEDWPEAWVLGSFVIVVGAVVAWSVPEGAWTRLAVHTGGGDVYVSTGSTGNDVRLDPLDDDEFGEGYDPDDDPFEGL